MTSDLERDDLDAILRRYGGLEGLARKVGKNQFAMVRSEKP